MKFTTSAIAAVVAFAAGSITVSAFTAPGAAFVSTRAATNSVAHSAGCPCGSCASSHSANCLCGACVRSHTAGCTCLACGMSTALRMSSAEEVAAVEEVPTEVVALDGVADDEEAHNADRPARDSGIKKHKNKGGAKTAIGDLVIGSYVDGTVKTVTSYGAFVDIGAATDALLHVSRLSKEFVSNVEDVIKVGQAVNVRIASVDAEKNQVAISMISEDDEKNAQAARSGGGKRKERPQRSGGDRNAQVATMNSLVEAGFDDEKMIEGEVVSALDFGAFVRFDASQLAASVVGELDGLVHISALTTGRASSVQSLVKVGDKVQIRVRSLDTEGNKVSLSMITKAEEEENRPQRGGGKPRRGKEMFAADEMGAKDWKESMEKFHAVSDVFSNPVVVIDRRK
jgi:predicted RNA-binding protein with RPS1 domain